MSNSVDAPCCSVPTRRAKSPSSPRRIRPLENGYRKHWGASDLNVERVRNFVRGYFRVFHRIRYHGQDNIPEGGALIFAPTHQSYYDPMLVATGQPLHPLRFMAWSELFEGEGKFARLLRSWGAFPVDIHGRDTSGMREAIKILRGGGRLVVFPEGERSRDGKLLPLEPGVARIAIQTAAPIVPVRIVGADRAWPRGDTFPRPWFPIAVTYCEPIVPREAKGGTARREESERIMTALKTALEAGPLITKR